MGRLSPEFLALEKAFLPQVEVEAQEPSAAPTKEASAKGSLSSEFLALEKAFSSQGGSEPQLVADIPKKSPEELAAWSKKLISPITGNPRPIYANGADPHTAINQSPLTAEERLKLKLGNISGNISFLKQRYEDVNVVDDGSVRVKQDGLWYKVDPKTGLAENAWDAIKTLGRAALEIRTGNVQKGLKQLGESKNELVGDIADTLPLAGAIGTQAAVAYATGGTSLVAQAAAAGVAGGAYSMARTSMGKIVDTYDGEPVDQIEEAGVETLLNAAGTVIVPVAAAGFAKAYVKSLDAAAKVYSKLPDSSKSALANLVGPMVNVSQRSIDRFMVRSNQVIDQVKKIGQTAGGLDVAEYEQNLMMKDLIERTGKAVSDSYEKELTEVFSQLPSDFGVNIADAGATTLDDLGKAGFLVNSSKGSHDIITGKPLLKYEPKLVTPEELIRIANNDPENTLAKELASSATARELFSDYLTQLKVIKEANSKVVGEKAVKAIVAADRRLGETLNRLNKLAHEDRLHTFANELTTYITKARSSVDDLVEKSLAVGPSTQRMKAEMQQLSANKIIAHKEQELKAMGSDASFFAKWGEQRIEPYLRQNPNAPLPVTRINGELQWVTREQRRAGFKAIEENANKLYEQYKNVTKRPIVEQLPYDQNAIDQYVKDHAKDTIAKYHSFKAGWSDTRAEANRLLEVNVQLARKGNDALQKVATLKNQLLSEQPSQQSGTKRNFLNTLDKLGSIDPEIKKAYDNILDIQAAKEFTPIQNQSFAKFGLVSTTIGTATAAVTTEGDPSRLAAGAAIGASLPFVASPKALLLYLRANKAAGQALSNSLMAGRGFLESMTPEARYMFLNDPAAVRAFSNSILQVVPQREQAKKSLMEMVPGSKK